MLVIKRTKTTDIIKNKITFLQSMHQKAVCSY